MLLAVSTASPELAALGNLEVVKTYDDGRMDILAVGANRFAWVSCLRRTRCSKAAWTISTIATHQTRRKRKNLFVEIYEACHTLIFGDYPRDGNSARRANPAFLHDRVEAAHDLLEAARFGIAHRSEPRSACSVPSGLGAASTEVETRTAAQPDMEVFELSFVQNPCTGGYMTTHRRCIVVVSPTPKTLGELRACRILTRARCSAR